MSTPDARTTTAPAGPPAGWDIPDPAVWVPCERCGELPDGCMCGEEYWCQWCGCDCLRCDCSEVGPSDYCRTCFKEFGIR